MSRGLGDVYKRQFATRLAGVRGDAAVLLAAPVSYTHLTLPTTERV
ncbi:hypothetical protein JMUB7557_27780 [Staphylococcus aureus]